jgi:hypothetical protein
MGSALAIGSRLLSLDSTALGCSRGGSRSSIPWSPACDQSAPFVGTAFWLRVYHPAPLCVNYLTPRNFFWNCGVAGLANQSLTSLKDAAVIHPGSCQWQVVSN